MYKWMYKERFTDEHTQHQIPVLSQNQAREQFYKLIYSLCGNFGSLSFFILHHLFVHTFTVQKDF